MSPLATIDVPANSIVSPRSLLLLSMNRETNIVASAHGVGFGCEPVQRRGHAVGRFVACSKSTVKTLPAF